MLPPDIEGKYELLGTLGASIGVVYAARDRMIERRVAIKVVRRATADGPEAAEANARFRREAQAAGRLGHPNIVIVYDYGENQEQAWIVMELVEGGSLQNRLDRQEAFPLAEVARLMEQTLAALAFSHARNIVHRDIKPANIMLTPDGTVKLADFGIARLEDSSMTQVGSLIGTPSYMAPEQLRGETVDQRADIWAAGVLLYVLLTGRKPFEGGFSAVMHKALNTEPTPPSDIARGLPPALDAVVARAMAKRPEDRWPDAQAFALAIRAAVAPAGIEAVAAPSPPPPKSEAPDASAPRSRPDPMPRPAVAGRGKAGLWLGVGAAFAMAAMAGFFLLPGGGSGPRPRDPPTIGEPTEDPVAREVRERLERERLERERLERERLDRERLERELQEREREEGVEQERVRRAALLGAITAAVGSTPCTLLALASDPRAGPQLRGIIPRGSAPALRQALRDRGAPPDLVAPALRLTGFEGPYCPVLDQLRAGFRLSAMAEPVALLGTVPLARGEPLRFAVPIGDAPASLHVAYLSSSGDVYHLVAGEPAAANALVRRGDPRPGFPGWLVDEPYGTDLLLVFLTERPLFARPLPAQQRVADFAAALGPVIRQLQDQGARWEVRPLVVETVQRR